MIRRTFRFLSAMSMLLCMASCGLWAAQLDRPRAGEGWCFRGNRYTWSFSPRALTLLGPPSAPRDPAILQIANQLANDLRDDAGRLRFDGFTSTNHGVAFQSSKASQAFSGQSQATWDAATQVLLAALEEPTLYVKAHAFLMQHPAAEKIWPYAQMDFNSSYSEMTQHGRRRGVYGGLTVTLVEDTPRTGSTSWGKRISGSSGHRPAISRGSEKCGTGISTSPAFASLTRWHRRCYSCCP